MKGIGPVRDAWHVVPALGLVFLGACQPAGGASESRALGIVGYNYTDRYIDEFYVDGQGGGNLDLSTPTAGGGKLTCCIGWRDGRRLPQKVRVKWVAGGCMKTVTSSEGYVHQVPVHAFKEQDVELTGPVPQKPGYFEVHFYPDGHIEVAITETWSEPRLKLDPAREKPTYAESCEETNK